MLHHVTLIIPIPRFSECPHRCGASHDRNIEVWRAETNMEVRCPLLTTSFSTPPPHSSSFSALWLSYWTILPYHSCHHSYSKEEGLDAASTAARGYTFLLISAVDYSHFRNSHKLIGKAEGFSRLSINLREFPPVKIVLRDQILLLMQQGCSSVVMETETDPIS